MAFFNRTPAEIPPLPYDAASPEGLVARWVRWAASCPTNPIEDTTGALADQEQPEDVFFLAGTYGGRVSRSCTIPADRAVFVPVFNMWEWPAFGAPPVVERAFGRLSLDGTSQKPDVIATPVPFVVAGVRGNAVTGKAKPVPVTVWGLWKRLAPLGAGHHTVDFTGGDGYGFEVSAEYRLTVV